MAVEWSASGVVDISFPRVPARKETRAFLPMVAAARELRQGFFREAAA